MGRRETPDSFVAYENLSNNRFTIIDRVVDRHFISNCSNIKTQKIEYLSLLQEVITYAHFQCDSLHVVFNNFPDSPILTTDIIFVWKSRTRRTCPPQICFWSFLCSVMAYICGSFYMVYLWSIIYLYIINYTNLGSHFSRPTCAFFHDAQIQVFDSSWFTTWPCCYVITRPISRSILTMAICFCQVHCSHWACTTWLVFVIPCNLFWIDYSVNVPLFSLGDQLLNYIS